MIAKLLLTSLLAVSLGAGSFDDSKIVASFGVLSDTHVNGVKTTPGFKFKIALQELSRKAAMQDADGLDAVLIAGDLIDNAYANPEHYRQVDMFKEIYESVLDPVHVPLVYTPGNHDVYKEWTSDAIAQAQNISQRLGSDYFTTDLDLKAKSELECRHCVVKGMHILCILPVDRKPILYTEAQKSWLDRQLAEITAAEPDRYVLILTHPMIHETVYGSELGSYWETEDLTPILSKYPQAIVFGGHLHFPLNDPRSIWQGRFTSMGCGSVRYMAIEDGGYENMASKTVMRDANEFSQGLLLQVDAEGNVRVTRMDFYRKSTIGDPWIISHPVEDGSHLDAYSHVLRAELNQAPQMSGFNLRMGAGNAAGIPVSIAFPTASDDEFIHHYELKISSGDSVLCHKKVLADFYRVSDVARMKKNWEQSMCTLRPGTYQVSVTAFDSWGASSVSEQTLVMPDITLDVPVSHDWIYTGRGRCRLDVNVSGADAGDKTLDLSLVRDLSLMSQVKDTVLVRSSRIRLKDGKAALRYDLGKLEPGFYQVTLQTDGQIYRRFNIGVNPELIDSPQDKHEDFDEFWENTLAELAAVPMDVQMTVDPKHSDEHRTTYIVKMKSLGGEVMGGILCKPNKPGKYVTYIDYLGYGANVIWYDPAKDVDKVEFLVSVRDQGILKRQGQYRWIDRGLESRENFYYRGAFCDVVRAIDFICSLDCVDLDRLFARGESQGGAFTLVSASLDHRIKAIAPSVPFLSDFRDYSRIVKWPLWEMFDQCKKQGISREQLFEMLTYFDVKNFTDRIQCPVFMAFALQDATCPPHTNFAGYNQITAPKQYYCLPLKGHEAWADKTWHKLRAEWFVPFENRQK